LKQLQSIYTKEALDISPVTDMSVRMAVLRVSIQS